MRPHLAVRCGLSALAAASTVAVLAGCGGTPPATTPPPSVAPEAADPDDGARAGLAARAALAVDRSFVALYSWRTPGREPRRVVTTVAADGTWRVDVPGGARQGSADVALAQTAQGVFQCALPPGGGAVATACVRVADRGRRVPDAYDPRVQRVFRQWLGVFQDRQSALAVTPARALPGSSGDCFAVDSISASLAAAVDVGIYCYQPDGLLTAARVDAGTVTLSGAPAPGPATVALPGPASPGPALGVDEAPDVPPAGVPSGVPPGVPSAAPPA